MPRRTLDLLATQTEEAYAFARRQVDGLTDDEFFWEPVAGAWSIRENRGENPPEFGLQTPNTRRWYFEDDWVWVRDAEASWRDEREARPTTIAWLLVHLGSCKVMYHQDAFAPGDLTFDDLVPNTARDAVALYHEGHARVRAAIESIEDDSELDSSRELPRTNFGDVWPTWQIFWTLVRHDLEHGAEIGRLRSLYREHFGRP